MECSDWHILGLLLVLCCALLAVLLLQMLDNILEYAAGLIVLCCTGLAHVWCRTWCVDA